MIEAHLACVVDAAESVDSSLSAMGCAKRGIEGIPQTDPPFERFLRPISPYNERILRYRGRRGATDSRAGSGVILTLTAAKNEPPTPRATRIEPTSPDADFRRASTGSRRS